MAHRSSDASMAQRSSDQRPGPKTELPALMNPVAGDIWYNSSDAHSITLL